MEVRLSRLAAQELADAREWYEAEQPGLGQRFNQAIADATRRIARASVAMQW